MISLDLPQKFLAEAAHILASTPLIGKWYFEESLCIF